MVHDSQLPSRLLPLKNESNPEWWERMKLLHGIDKAFEVLAWRMEYEQQRRIKAEFDLKNIMGAHQKPS